MNAPDRSRQKIVVLVMASAMAVAVIAVTSPPPRPKAPGEAARVERALGDALGPAPAGTLELCGGSRREGRSFRTRSADLCGLQESGDMSCDRWGCAILADDRTGRTECPLGHLDFRTDADPEYFLCFRPPYGGGGAGVCGGGRRDGRGTGCPDEDAPGAALRAAEDAQTCQRWGCARVADPATGRIECPAGAASVKVGDDPAYLLCLGASVAFTSHAPCGGYRRDGLDGGWGCVTKNSLTGAPECRTGALTAPVGEDPPTYLCLGG